METEKAQDTQIILGDALCGIADEAHAAIVQIVETAGVVIDPAVASHRQRIDREVPPLGIRPPVAAELDLGVAAVGLDILAQRGHFERLLVDDNRDRAVLDAGRHRLESGGGDALHDFFRNGGGGDIHFRDRYAEQRIAHRPADDARLLAVAVQHGKQPRQRARGKPGIADVESGAAVVRHPEVAAKSRPRTMTAPFEARGLRPSCLRATACFAERLTISLTSWSPARTCHFLYAPARKSIRAALRKNARNR